VIEIVFYGRGGQGSVTAVQILAQAAFSEGYYAQAFPKFGIERRGAPVSAYARISDNIIQSRGNMEQADCAIVGDMMAVQPHALFKSMKNKGLVIFNTTKSTSDFRKYAEKYMRTDLRLFTVGATGISRKVYGETSIPITSAAMLGAFCAASKVVKLDSVTRALHGFFPPNVITKNVKAIQMAFEEIKGE